MKINKKLIPILVVIFVFGIYFIGNSIHFETNVLKVNHKAANLELIEDAGLRECVSDALSDLGSTEFSSIVDLKCQYKSIGKLNGIENLTALESVDLEGNIIKNADILSQIATLEKIGLKSNYISEINVRSLENLIHLDLRSNKIEKASALQFPTSLTTLYVSDNYLSDEFDLSHFPNISRLYINTNPAITSIKLANINKLVGINASDCSLKSIEDIHDGNDNITSISHKLETLAVNGLKMSNSLKELIINNADTLVNLQIGRSGITDVNFLVEHASELTNLKILTLGSNKISTVDLSSFPALEDIDLRSMGLQNLVIGNKGIVKKLYLYNNNLGTFNTEGYDTLKELYLDKNNITDFDFSANTSLLTVSLNDNDLSSTFSVNKLPSNVEYLSLVNTKLSGNQDFSSLANLIKLEINNDSTKGTENYNTFRSLKINPNLTTLITNHVKELTNLTTSSGTSNLRTLNVISTGITTLDLSNYPNLNRLYIAGTNISNIDLTPVLNSIRELDLNGSSYVDNFDFNAALPNLTSLAMPIDKLADLNLSNYPNLAKLSLSYRVILDVITSNGVTNLQSIIYEKSPSNIKFSNLYRVFDDTKNLIYKDAYATTISVENGHKTFYINDPKATITNYDFGNYDGVVDVYGTYELTGVNVSSEEYEIDDNLSMIAVGTDSDETILSKISLSDENATKSIEGDYLVINYRNVERRYKLVKEIPDYIDPETDSQHNSVAPDEKTDYGTTDNPKTGTILSFIALVLLIASGIVMKYYLDVKRKNTELIEKI